MLLRRIGVVVPTLFVVSVVSFLLLQLVPGNPAVLILGTEATNEQVATLNHQLGVDRPVLVQYLDYLGRVLHGDLGHSVYSGASVASTVASRLPVTLSLVFASTILALVAGVALGLFAGLRPGGRLDTAVLAGTSIGLSIPGFWLALLLVIPLAVWARIFPATGYVPLLDDPYGWLRSILLGAVALAVPSSAAVARQARSAVAEVMARDYIRAARARGLSRRRTVVKHGLKNAAIPVVTVLGFHVNAAISGALFVELIFGLNGIGSLAVGAVEQHDIPVVQGIVLITACVVILVNALVDLTYGWLNPKVRVG